MGTSPFSRNLKGDVIDTSLFSLKGKGDGIAISPIYLEGMGMTTYPPSSLEGGRDTIIS